MQREWDMNEVSDGRRYQNCDAVALGCDDCSGCSACCHDMGNSIQLDPYDVYRISKEIGKSFQEMIEHEISLSVVDGTILPHLKMQENTTSCIFLNEQGRCKIHRERPGICRLFPLGRIYDDSDVGFSYFLQVHECQKQNRSDVVIADWLGIERLKIYEKFIADWHYFVKDWQARILEELDKEQAEKQAKKQNQKTSDQAPDSGANSNSSTTMAMSQQMMQYLLMLFYQKMYDQDREFFPQFYKRLKAAKQLLDEL